MKCFTARAQGQDSGTIIIARSGSHAAEIFVTHYVAMHGEPPPVFEVSRNDLRQLPLLDDLRAMIRGDVSGVVAFDAEEGHTLTPM